MCSCNVRLPFRISLSSSPDMSSSSSSSSSSKSTSSSSSSLNRSSSSSSSSLSDAIALSILSLGNLILCKFLTGFVIDSLLVPFFSIVPPPSFFFFDHPSFKLVWFRKSLMLIIFFSNSIDSDVICLPGFLPLDPSRPSGRTD